MVSTYMQLIDDAESENNSKGSRQDPTQPLPANVVNETLKDNGNKTKKARAGKTKTKC
jgi:hypothetical protein